MAHEGNHICLYRFSFIYVTNDLREDAYTCPINVMNSTTKSVIYVMELTVSCSLQPQLIAEAPEAEQLVLVQASPDICNDVWLEDASPDVDA